MHISKFAPLQFKHKVHAAQANQCSAQQTLSTHITQQSTHAWQACSKQGSVCNMPRDHSLTVDCKRYQATELSIGLLILQGPRHTACKHMIAIAYIHSPGVYWLHSNQCSYSSTLTRLIFGSGCELAPEPARQSRHCRLVAVLGGEVGGTAAPFSLHERQLGICGRSGHG